MLERIFGSRRGLIAGNSVPQVLLKLGCGPAGVFSKLLSGDVVTVEAEVEDEERKVDVVWGLRPYSRGFESFQGSASFPI